MCSGPCSMRFICAYGGVRSPLLLKCAARQFRFGSAEPGEGVRLQIDSTTGKSVLLYPEGIVELNETAHEILSRCDGRTLGEIVCELAEEYEADSNALAARCTRYALGFAATQSDRIHMTVPRPYALLAEITYRCPLHCPYCSNPVAASLPATPKLHKGGCAAPRRPPPSPRLRRAGRAAATAMASSRRKNGNGSFVKPPRLAFCRSVFPEANHLPGAISPN